MVGGECALILQLNLSVNQNINSLIEKNAHTICITTTLSSESAIIYHEST